MGLVPSEGVRRIGRAPTVSVSITSCNINSSLASFSPSICYFTWIRFECKKARKGSRWSLGEVMSSGMWKCDKNFQSIILAVTARWGFPGGAGVKNPPANAGDPRDDGSVPGSGRCPREGKWQPTPGFLRGESHGQGSLEGYSPWVTKSWTGLSNLTHTCTCIVVNRHPSSIRHLPDIVFLDNKIY